ncbi:MAG TPA: LemA family protein [Candidatus Limnocylindrales bacterium]|nr:LemA family protein [Candidatus Limnocylindrales bacterium]
MNAPLLAAAFAVGTAIAIAMFVVVATYNDVVALGRRIDKAWANIEVALQQRHDLLPALVDAVRGVMTFERDVLTDVTRARAAFSPGAPIPEQAATSATTSRAVRTLLATVESYPELKSAGNVLALQKEIERLESMIADRRELYNDQVYRYDARIAQLPGVLLASVFGWRPRPFFAAGPGSDEPPTAALGFAEPPDPPTDGPS